MSRYVWLASYPKSGNTWVRIFLANFLRDGAAPVDINQIGDGDIAASREPLDAALGCDSTDLRPDEIERLRPEFYCFTARRAREPLYTKVHDAFTHLPDGRALFPAEASRAALHIVRNPLDVCVSFSHHAGHDDFARTIDEMADPERRLGRNQLPQRLLTWSGHVLSWGQARGMPVHVMRYEDLLQRPEESFGAMVRFLGLPDDPARVARAIRFSQFEEVQRQDRARAFTGRGPGGREFFRQGAAGSWRGVLGSGHVQRLIADHGEVMRRFGYLTPAGAPAF